MPKHHQRRQPWLVQDSAHLVAKTPRPHRPAYRTKGPLLLHGASRCHGQDGWLDQPQWTFLSGTCRYRDSRDNSTPSFAYEEGLFFAEKEYGYGGTIRLRFRLHAKEELKSASLASLFPKCLHTAFLFHKTIFLLFFAQRSTTDQMVPKAGPTVMT